VQALADDSDGNVWIGTTGSGLTRWQQDRFSTLTVSNGLPSDSVNALTQDNQGRLWVGTEGGLVLWQDDL